MDVLKYIITIVLSYLLGSISSGLLITKAFNGPNLRKVGSGNTGTTNVIRAMGKKYGYLTFACDFLKAILSCLIGQLLIGHTGAMVGGIFCVFGHNWPVFFGFKGGKGVCSSMAVLTFCYPVQAVICFIFGFAVMFITKYVSAGSMTGAAVYIIEMLICMIFGIQLGSQPVGIWAFLWALLVGGLCIWRHKANIQRILNGTENKIGQKKKQA